MMEGGRSALARILIRVAERLAPPPVSPTASPAVSPASLPAGSTPPAANRAEAGPAGAGLRPPAPSAAPRPRDEVPSAKRLAISDSDVTGWVGREARAVRSIVASGLQLLDLSELQQRYADRWDRVGSAIRRVVESTIDRHLGDRDLWVRGDGETWILLVEGAAAAEAASRARAIAAEVARRLVGDGEEDGDAASQTRIQQSGIRQSGIQAASAGIHVHSISVELDEPPERIGSMRALLASWSRSVAAAHARADAAIAGLGDAIEVTYQPVFNPRLLAAKRALCGQRVQVRATGDRARGADATGRMQAAIDAEAVRRAIAVATSGGGIVFAPVRFDTLAHREHAEPLLEALRNAPQRARRRLVLEVQGIEAAIPQPRVLTVLTPVYSFVLAVAVAVDPADPDQDRSLARFVGRQHALASMSTRAIAGDPAGSLGVIRMLMRRHQMRLAVFDVPNQTVARQLHRGGHCRFLAGDGMAPARQSPLEIRRHRQQGGSAGGGPGPGVPAKATA